MADSITTRDGVYFKGCTDCGGEGLLARWCFYGSEMPASYKERYPLDTPPEGTDTKTAPCPTCKGTGQYGYLPNGQMVTPED